MELKRKILIPAVGLLAVAGIGTGVAVAQSGSDSTSPPTDSTQVQPGAQPGQPEGAETKDEKGEKEEKDGKEAEEPNDPEPGHEDPDGVNVDHTPAGEQPEPAKVNYRTSTRTWCTRLLP
jgi:hypothetical protein